MKKIIIQGKVLILFSMLSLIACESTTPNVPATTNIPTATNVGIYNKNKKVLLIPSFINAVNGWLGRYSPTLVTREDDYAKMTVRYKYLFNVEIFVKDEEYDIVVTLAENASSGEIQNLAVKLSRGVCNSTSKYLIRGTRSR
jgi:hypothetical protein